MNKPFVLHARAKKRVTIESPDKPTEYKILIRVDGVSEIEVEGRLELKSASNLLNTIIGEGEFDIVFKTTQTKLVQ